MKKKDGLRPCCLQHVRANCTFTAAPCLDEFINTREGLLLNTAARGVNNSGHQISYDAKTQLIKWAGIVEILLDNVILRAPDSELHNVEVLNHFIEYDQYMVFSMTQVIDENAVKASMDRKVWSVKKSLDNFVSKVSMSPFLSNTMEMIIGGIAIAIAIPLIIEVIKCLWSRIWVTTDALTRGVTNN